jgi:hypothetical protein
LIEERLRALAAQTYAVTQAHEAVTQELAETGRIQEGLLPDEKPDIHRWEHDRGIGSWSGGRSPGIFKRYAVVRRHDNDDIQKGSMMSKSILILKGSPRKHGNSAALADQIYAGAKKAGAEVESVYLSGLEINPCDACDACQEGDQGCIVQDDMQALYPQLKAADVIVLASPIYYFTITAQIKAFIDRWYA